MQNILRLCQVMKHCQNVVIFIVGITWQTCQFVIDISKYISRALERESQGPAFRLIKGTRLRKEIWLRPEGGRRLHRTTSAQDSSAAASAAADEEEAELRDMATSDLNRRFINTYLYLIGKLYTGINVDSYGMALETLQKEFRVLVSR